MEFSKEEHEVRPKAVSTINYDNWVLRKPPNPSTTSQVNIPWPRKSASKSISEQPQSIDQIWKQKVIAQILEHLNTGKISEVPEITPVI